LNGPFCLQVPPRGPHPVTHFPTLRSKRSRAAFVSRLSSSLEIHFECLPYFSFRKPPDHLLYLITSSRFPDSELLLPDSAVIAYPDLAHSLPSVVLQSSPGSWPISLFFFRRSRRWLLSFFLPTLRRFTEHSSSSLLHDYLCISREPLLKIFILIFSARERLLALVRTTR